MIAIRNILIHSKKTISICIILFFTNCTPFTIHTPDNNLEILRKNIAYLLSDPNISNAQVGILIESLNTKEVIFKKSEHKLFIPASNVKLFTTAVTLLKFEPKFRYNTELFFRDSIIGDELYGNVVIKGQGDPTISDRFSGIDILNIFSDWADSLISKNIKIINGDIIGDESYFQNTPLGFGWQWDDEPYAYSAQLSALSLNENCVDVIVNAAKVVGQPTTIELFPVTKYFDINNLSITTSPDCVKTILVTRPRLKNTIIIKNELPINKPVHKTKISVENPALFFTKVFSEILKEKEIIFRGKIRTVKKPEIINYSQYKRVLNYKSPPLEEIIKVVNKSSQNLYAEQLLLTLGAEYGNIGSAKEGIKVIYSSLMKMGISDDEFIMYDGSGLSRNNLITPSAIIKLLHYMAKYKYSSHFNNSLSIAGYDGTLEDRMKDCSAEGKVYAKTGGMKHIKALSGYALSKDNEKFVFSIMVNNFNIPSKALELLQDKICILLCNFKRKK